MHPRLRALALAVGVHNALAGPVLAITHTPVQVTISWTPATGTNWVLQEVLNVTGAWANAPHRLDQLGHRARHSADDILSSVQTLICSP